MNKLADILFEREGGLAIVTLNRPRALNALTYDMVLEMARQLNKWAADGSVRVVLIRGAGDRGLCAGGDIRSIYDAARSGALWPIRFWRDEYRLNRMISEYPKPVVALMHGIVMGGGIGISAHASHRIVTETTNIAMPEVSIGLIPDVGGTYLLSHAPGELGTHLALTGGSVGAADALALGFADYHVRTVEANGLANFLAKARTRSEVEAILVDFRTPAGDAPLLRERNWIDQVYAADEVETICERLKEREEPAAAEALKSIERNSPTSLKATLRALRKARAFGKLAPCLDMELSLVSHCFQSHDLVEGIRAAIIDKDRNPSWSPAELEKVGGRAVENFFVLPEVASAALLA
jgi:enoyl-CoA hydratase